MFVHCALLIFMEDVMSWRSNLPNISVQRTSALGHVGPQRNIFLIPLFSITVESSQTWFGMEVPYMFLCYARDRLFIYVKKLSQSGQKLKKAVQHAPHSPTRCAWPACAARYLSRVPPDSPWVGHPQLARACPAFSGL